LDEIVTPFITLHGTIDKATLPYGSELLYEKSTSKDKTIKIYKNQNHELLWEPMYKEVHDDIMDWFEKRIPLKEEEEKKIDEEKNE